MIEGVTYEKNVDLRSVCNNMDKLIPLFNHNITEMKKDVETLKNDGSWIKRIMSIQTGLLTALVLGLLWALLKITL